MKTVAFARLSKRGDIVAVSIPVSSVCEHHF